MLSSTAGEGGGLCLPNLLLPSVLVQVAGTWTPLLLADAHTRSVSLRRDVFLAWLASRNSNNSVVFVK